MKEKKINGDELKPKGLEKIPSYKDLMKERFKVDSTKVIDKPEINFEQKEKIKMMTGWKVWFGAFLMLVSIIVTYILQMPEVGEAIRNLALMFLGVGIAHKVEKAGNK